MTTFGTKSIVSDEVFKKSAMKQAASSQEYAKARKRHLEHSGEIRCGRCPYHRGVNVCTN